MKYGTFSSDLLHHSFSTWLELTGTQMNLYIPACQTWAHKKSAFECKSRQMEA